jgi:enamine deaminase RidA (YjgF/YER057c/UK114 family)
MKILLLIPVLLAGCATKDYAYSSGQIPPVQLVLDSTVQQMSRQDVINATHSCEFAGLRAAPIMSKRLVSGMMSDIIIDVQCMPKMRLAY